LEPSAAPKRAPQLARFFSALGALARRERSQSVRISWFGDSHTAADYLTGAVRAALVRHYGSGGPGFVRVGLPSYRHDLVTVTRVGAFHVAPVSPARRAPQGDGVFGPGGIRVTPTANAARITLKLLPHAAVGSLRFSVLFDLPPGAAFVISADQQSLEVSDRERGERLTGSPISRVALEADATSLLGIEVRAGRPRFYGVLVESTKPGVVLDTFGINGARVATPLAWAEAPFIAEIGALQPDLVVVAYGTNEAFDDLRVEAYDRQLGDLLGRLQRAAPQADCLVVGPPDALSPNFEPAARVAAIADVHAQVAARLGCAFVSAQGLMGGPGAFRDWLRRDPPLASSDRIHLTPRGYRRLGELVAASAFGEPASGADKNSP
jgi:lysophospholipase L1-like esterase